MRNNYFQNRNIGTSFYKSYKLPRYYSDLIYSKESKILDIGCGLGQTMVALKDLGYNDVDGVDIDDHAVKYCKSSDLHVRKIKDLVSFCKKTNKKYDF